MTTKQSPILTILIALCCALFPTCNTLDVINNRLDELEADIRDLQTAVNSLKKASDEAKIISSVEPITDSDSGGWVLSFTDNTSIRLTNGKDGITPFLSIDQDGFWAASYDSGQSFFRLQDAFGNPIPSRGKDGVSVKVSTDNAGHYVFELYHPSDPNTIIDRYITPLDSNPAHLISSISEDKTTHCITLTMQDGQVFTFNIRYNTPSSIGLLINKIHMGVGMTASFDFRVNPSNATFNYDLSSDACQISLDRVGIATKESGYITEPTNYKLTAIEQVYDETGVIKAGQYRAQVTDLGLSDHYDDLIALVLTVDNGSGEMIQISSSAIEIDYSHTLLTDFRFLSEDNPTVLDDVEATIIGNDVILVSPFIMDASSLIPRFISTGQEVRVSETAQTSGISSQNFTSPVAYTVVAPNGESRTYTVQVKYSGLPIVYIDTPGAVSITSKEEWLSGASIRIVDTDGSTNYLSDELQIRGRGNTTWGYPKKPFALKLKNKSKILGMPKHKRWVLLANWMDRTLLRNDIAFQISRQTGLAYTVRGRYVEVVMNGHHIGNYYLCEQIKIDENRVNIQSLSLTDIEGDAVTGGYLMELDNYFDEVNKFKSAIRDLPYMFKEPDEEDLQPEQFNYFKDFINNMEAALYAEDWLTSRDYANYMDLNSFVDRLFVQELAGNCEDWAPRSHYVYKDRLGKLTAGPVWDYDYFTFEPIWSQTWLCKVYTYYPRLFQDPVFVALVKTRWEALKPGFATIPAYIRAKAEQIRVSNELNLNLWPVTFNINEDGTLPYDEAIERLANYVETKLAWMDVQFAAM